MSHYLVALGHNVDGSFADVEAEIKQQFFVVDRVVRVHVCVCVYQQACVLMWWLKHVCIHMCDSKREREMGRERERRVAIFNLHRDYHVIVWFVEKN